MSTSGSIRKPPGAMSSRCCPSWRVRPVAFEFLEMVEIYGAQPGGMSFRDGDADDKNEMG